MRRFGGFSRWGKYGTDPMGIVLTWVAGFDCDRQNYDTKFLQSSEFEVFRYIDPARERGRFPGADLYSATVNDAETFD